MALLVCLSQLQRQKGHLAFSTMRWVKTYLRNIMTTNSLSGLGLMHVYRKKHISAEMVLDIFSRPKERMWSLVFQKNNNDLYNIKIEIQFWTQYILMVSSQTVSFQPPLDISFFFLVRGYNFCWASQIYWNKTLTKMDIFWHQQMFPLLQCSMKQSNCSQVTE